MLGYSFLAVRYLTDDNTSISIMQGQTYQTKESKYRSTTLCYKETLSMTTITHFFPKCGLVKIRRYFIISEQKSKSCQGAFSVLFSAGSSKTPVRVRCFLHMRVYTAFHGQEFPSCHMSLLQKDLFSVSLIFLFLPRGQVVNCDAGKE